MNRPHLLGESAELAALYAAGAMTYEERTEFETHLASGCPACQAEVEQFSSVEAALATAVRPVSPDPKTKERLLARVATQPRRQGDPSPLRRHLQRSVPPQEQAPRVLFQRAADATWENTSVPGVSIRVLFVDAENNHFTAMVRMAPGTSYPGHIHGGPEECLVLEGELYDDDELMRPGDYQRAPAGSAHGVQRTENGCVLLITSSLSDVFI